MSGSYFNEDQQAEMRYLASLGDDNRCACGWYPLRPNFAHNKCPNCPEGKSRAQELADRAAAKTKEQP